MTLLLFIIAADDENINETYKILLNELKMFNSELLDKPRILAISKSDLIDVELKAMLLDEIDIDVPILFFSSVTQDGISQLKDEIWKSLNA